MRFEKSALARRSVGVLDAGVTAVAEAAARRRRFAARVKQHGTAVRAALTPSKSNGQADGKVASAQDRKDKHPSGSDLDGYVYPLNSLPREI